MNSPSATSMLTSFTAGKPSPYFLTMFFMSMAAMRSPLHCAGGEAGDDLSLEQQDDDDDRDGDHHGGGGQQSVRRVERVGSDEEGQLRRAPCASCVVEVSEIASTNSFHAKKNVRIAAVKTPGAASGTITLRNACHEVAPSTWAACSISHGISRKNADSVQIASGSVNDMYGMIRPGQVLKRPSVRHRSNSGPTSETTGNIAIASASESTSRLPLNSSRAMAYAASVAKITDSNVAISAMPNELRSASTEVCGVCPRTCRSSSASGRGPSCGRNCGLPAAVSSGALERQRDDPDDRQQAPDEDERRSRSRCRSCCGSSSTWPSALTPRLGQVDPEELDDQPGQQQHGEEQQHRERRAEAELELLDRPADRSGTTSDSVSWAPAVITKMLSKIRKASSARNSTATMIAARMFGQDHLPQPLPPGGAVDLGGLDHVLGDLRQTGEQQQRHERRGLPDLGDHDREHRRPVAAEPVGVRADPRQPGEPGVHEAVVDAERELPGERRDDGDDAVGDQDRGPDRAAGEDDAVHHHREREADRPARPPP